MLRLMVAMGSRLQIKSKNREKTCPHKDIPELLAPAGNFGSFYAALEQGADAVYVGAPAFNARNLRCDFSLAEIGAMIKEAHKHRVKLFVAMNSLIKESELGRVIEDISVLASFKPDGLIIQDLGLLFVLRKWFPSISLHSSTLMSAHNSMGVANFAKLGFSRVVLARELTIEEITAIYRKTKVELEVFVHGAMCFSYSGLCLFSSLHGGKSSLRGQCVQPCRRHYLQSGGNKTKGKNNNKQLHLFSMHDLCGIDFLPELRAAGVRSLKIEGRLKSSSYVANCVAAYRMALDAIDSPAEEQAEVLKEAHYLLDDAMGRKRSSGYFMAKNPAALSPELTGASGTFLGRIDKLQVDRSGSKKNNQSIAFKVCLNLSDKLRLGDRLRLHDERSGERLSCSLRALQRGGRNCVRAEAGTKVWLDLQGSLRGMKLDDFKGSLFRVDVQERIILDKLSRQKEKKLPTVRVRADTGLVSKIVSSLSLNLKSVSASSRRKKTNQGRRTATGKQKMFYWLAVSRLTDLNQRLPFRPDRILLPLDKNNLGRNSSWNKVVRRNKGKMVWQLPPIIQEDQLDWFRQQVVALIKDGFFRFELGHISQIELFYTFMAVRGQKSRRKGAGDLVLYASCTLNIFNSAALHLLGQLGWRGAAFSLESEEDNLAQSLLHFRSSRLSASGRLETGMLAYGRPPLFTARIHDKLHTDGGKVVSPRQESFSLRRADNLTKVYAELPFSLLRWQNELKRMGLDYLLIDIGRGQIRQEIMIVSRLLNSKGRGRMDVLTGNFRRTMA